MGGKSHLGVLFGFAVSALILCFLLSRLEWELFVTELHRLSWIYLVPLFALFVLSYWIRAVRWQYLLPTGLGLSTFTLFSSVNLGAFATTLLPLRAGEFVRPWALSRSRRVSFSTGFS